MYELKGADDLAKLARILKEAGEKDLQKRLTKALTAAMKPVRADLQRSALAKLPRRGGLAKRVAGSTMRQSRRNTGRSVGVRLQVKNPDNIRTMDNPGFVRHPVFGRWLPNEKPQPVKPGWFTEPTDAARPAFAAAVDKAMNDIVAEIDGRTPPPP